MNPMSTLADWAQIRGRVKIELSEIKPLIEMFHGYTSPGVLLGAAMVQAAKEQIEPGVLYEAVCETAKCLPDAIQLFTPCTVGNSWLKIVDLGKYALALFDKYTGEGVRVWVDAGKLENWSEINAWFMKLKSKQEQDQKLLIDQIVQAGARVMGVQPVKLHPDFMRKKIKDSYLICPKCRESYPSRHGGACSACRTESPVQIYL